MPQHASKDIRAQVEHLQGLVEHVRSGHLNIAELMRELHRLDCTPEQAQDYLEQATALLDSLQPGTAQAGPSRHTPLANHIGFCSPLWSQVPSRPATPG